MKEAWKNEHWISLALPRYDWYGWWAPFHRGVEQNSPQKPSIILSAFIFKRVDVATGDACCGPWHCLLLLSVNQCLPFDVNYVISICHPEIMCAYWWPQWLDHPTGSHDLQSHLADVDRLPSLHSVHRHNAICKCVLHHDRLVCRHNPVKSSVCNPIWSGPPQPLSRATRTHQILEIHSFWKFTNYQTVWVYSQMY